MSEEAIFAKQLAVIGGDGDPGVLWQHIEQGLDGGIDRINGQDLPTPELVEAETCTG